MPLYEYRCESCGAQEETLESFSAPSEHACAKCGAPTGMRRQLSRTAFILAGDGWYASGYGDGKAAPTAGTAPGAAPVAAASPAEPAPAAPSGGCAGGCSCH